MSQKKVGYHKNNPVSLNIHDIQQMLTTTNLNWPVHVEYGFQKFESVRRNPVVSRVQHPTWGALYQTPSEKQNENVSSITTAQTSQMRTSLMTHMTEPGQWPAGRRVNVIGSRIWKHLPIRKWEISTAVKIFEAELGFDTNAFCETQCLSRYCKSKILFP